MEIVVGFRVQSGHGQEDAMYYDIEGVLGTTTGIHPSIFANQ